MKEERDSVISKKDYQFAKKKHKALKSLTKKQGTKKTPEKCSLLSQLPFHD